MTDSPAIWFYMLDDERVGPVPESLLRSLLWNGELPWGTMVWSQGRNEWSAATAVPALTSEETLSESGPPSLPPGVKSRHGCFIAWLIFAFAANVLIAVTYLLGTIGVVSGAVPGKPWVEPIFLVIVLVQIACLVALFRWRRWGFWGLVALSIVSGALNVAAFGRPYHLVVAVVSPLLWYGVLLIGGHRAAWSQLE